MLKNNSEKMLVRLHPWALVSLLGENRRAQSLTPQQEEYTVMYNQMQN